MVNVLYEVETVDCVALLGSSLQLGPPLRLRGLHTGLQAGRGSHVNSHQSHLKLSQYFYAKISPNLPKPLFIV